MSYSYYDNKPYHSLNLGWWSVFPKEQEKVVSYGRFKLYWEIISRRNRNYSWESEKEMIMWISIDDNPYVEYTYNWRYANPALHEELNSEIRKVRSTFQRARSKEKAKDNKALKEQLARKQGITVKELEAQNREKRLAKQEKNKASRITKQMDNILAAGPVIKALHDDLGAFLKYMNNGGHVNITRVNLKLRYFRYVQQILAQWKKAPKAKLR